ncbi:MAG TPA: HAD-IA family hydrolase [Polyangiaceae bacterium]
MCALAKAAIFDLDGVLLDTEPLYTQATTSVVAEFGKSYTWDLKRRIMGGSALAGAELIVAELELPISAAEYLRRRRVLLDQLLQVTVPIDGAETLVQSLHAFGLRLAIATSSERALFELKTRAHNWFSFFSASVCGDDPRLLNPKPAPDIFEMAAQELGVRSRDCVVFEDSPAGVLGASRSGARVVARRDPAISAEELAPADCVVDRYADLPGPEKLLELNR